MKTKLENAEMVKELRAMAAQILTPTSKGKAFFEAVANELEGLRHALNARQEEEGKAHRLFHEPLEYAPEIDWATLHGPGDGPFRFVGILREHLSKARRELHELKSKRAGF